MLGPDHHHGVGADRDPRVDPGAPRAVSPFDRHVGAIGPHGLHPPWQEAGLPDEARDEQRGRAQVDLLGRAEVFHHTTVHDGDAVRHRQGLALVVGDVHEADPDLALDALELELHLLAQLEVEGAERLVEQQHRRLVRQRARERDALLLTARELARVPLAVALEPHRRQGLLHALLDLFAGELLALWAERHVLGHGHVREQGVGLEHHVRVAFVGRQAGGVSSVHQDPALGRGLEPGEHPQGRGLATSARPQQREELPATHVEADAVDGHDLAEALHHVVEGQRDAVAGAVLDNGRIPSDVLGLGAHVFLLMTSPADDGSSPSGSRSTPPRRTTPAT